MMNHQICLEVLWIQTNRCIVLTNILPASLEIFTRWETLLVPERYLKKVALGRKALAALTGSEVAELHWCTEVCEKSSVFDV